MLLALCCPGTQLMHHNPYSGIYHKSSLQKPNQFYSAAFIHKNLSLFCCCTSYDRPVYPFSLCSWTRYHFHPSLQWQSRRMGTRAEQSYLIYQNFFHARVWIRTDVINSTLNKYLLINWNFTKITLLLIIIAITMLSLFYSL